ncbi:MAG: SBBP repeat-containing protein, partial [candidate division Zixibacteria bacterium]|nr:SBBP repeat-containing protein [candidate division Zixibacteria bacterium]
MKKAIYTLAVLAAGVFLWQVAIGQDEALTAVSKSLIMEQMQLHQLAFTENQGQWDDRVLFRANAGGAAMWFTRDGVYYQFTRRVRGEAGGPPFMVGTADATNLAGQNPRDPDDLLALPTVIPAQAGIQDRPNMDTRFRGHDNQNDRLESIMIKASFVGANPDPQMVGLEEMEYRCNYFIGNDPNEWHTDVPNYEYVLYEDVYPGIDLKYYGNGKQMEYDFIVSPGADPSQIRIRYEGAKSLSVNEAGGLEVETDWNTVTEQAPYVYQETAGGRREVVGRYRLLNSSTFGFALEKEYNSSLPLIIDPTLVYSTYLGGGSDERGEAIAVDGSGNAYVTGYTFSSDFPTENPYQTNQGGDYDAFVTKLNSSGNSLIYSTYLGGGSGDHGYGIVVDGSGNAYVTGTTLSSDFPTQNPYQATNQGGWDVFLTKLSSSGNSLIYSTCLGGGNEDYGIGIVVDGSGNAYVTGYTYSSDFPTE